MSDVRTDEAGTAEVRERIGNATESEGLRIDVGSLSEPTRTAVAITHGETGVMLTTLDVGRNVWTVLHLWGESDTWMPMIRLTVEELAARGHGNTPIIHELLEDRPDLLRAIQSVTKHKVTLASGKEVWQMTADEALSILGPRVTL